MKPSICLLTAVLFAALPLRAEELPTRCRVPDGLTVLTRPLPRTSARLANGEPVTIVALGSSSTAGEGASSPEASYPARLEALLRQRFPQQLIVVHNRGVNGEDEPQMLARFGRDVFALNPNLVIWQVGANAVLHNDNLDQFWRALDEGIDRLRAEGIEIILMDSQFAPRLLSRPNLIPIEAGLPVAAAQKLDDAVWTALLLLLIWLMNTYADTEIAAAAPCAFLLALRFWRDEHPDLARLKRAVADNAPYVALTMALCATRLVPPLRDFLKPLWALKPYDNQPAFAPLYAPGFWLLSIGGGGMLLIYALYRRDPVFILGQGLGLFIYVRNIVLVLRERRADHKSGDKQEAPKRATAEEGRERA